jgi:hypothetical protein
MKRFLQRNKLAYMLLITGLLIFAVVFSMLWPDREAQRVTAAVFGGGYFLWGILTHTKSKNLTKEIIFEYLAIAILAVLIMILITL